MKRMLKQLCRAALSVALILGMNAHAQTSRQLKLLYSEDFTGKLDTTRWHAEIEPVGNSEVHTENGRLILNTAGGVTVWFKPKLEGNIRIEYDWTVLVDSGLNDRLSDLNQFWMASDPRDANLFKRNGKFENYDSLSLYYVGFGGNSNTTTRFRKYHGDGTKPLLKEFLDSAHLLQANHAYHIVITVIDGRTTFSVDGEVVFDFADVAPLTRGWFGFRSTGARHGVGGFRVWGE